MYTQIYIGSSMATKTVCLAWGALCPVLVVLTSVTYL